jgi:hypothetical protein
MAQRLHGTPLRDNRKLRCAVVVVSAPCFAVDRVAGGIAEDETGCGGTTQVVTGNASRDTAYAATNYPAAVGRRASGFVLVA